jgi:hypothetical protein
VIEEIAVKLVPTKDPGKIVAALADVDLQLGEQGSMRICGYRVIVPDDGRPPWASPPARRGKSSWFQVVTLRGPIKPLVETAVLLEFERAKKTAPQETPNNGDKEV